jgi:DNA ligase (NAD+)
LIKFSNRNALVECIEENGGIVVSSVSAKTNYLITNDKDSGSSKNKKAEKFGTHIISEDEFLNMLN